MASVFDNRLNLILKAGVTPILRDLGFKKRQLVYVNRLEELSWLLDIQKSRWNDESEAQFTINCGVFVPGVLAVYANISDPINPKIEDCTCSARIGMLMPQKKDIWWKITSGDSEETELTVARDLGANTEAFALTFLSQFNSPIDVADFLSSSIGEEFNYIGPRAPALRLAYSAIIYSKLGDSKKASRNLELAIVDSSNSPIEGFIKRLRHKI